MVAYTRLNPNIFRGLSVTNVVLWVVCTGLVTAITIRYTNLGAGITENAVGNLDFVYAGLWSSLSYGIAGLVGMCASYTRRRKQMISLLVLCGIGCAGAIAAAGIAGYIAVYITHNKGDVNDTICHPEVLYPPVFTQQQAEEDCRIWAILEYTLMSYSIAAAAVNAVLLVCIGVAMTGPKVHSNLV